MSHNNAAILKCPLHVRPLPLLEFSLRCQDSQYPFPFDFSYASSAWYLLVFENLITISATTLVVTPAVFAMANILRIRDSAQMSVGRLTAGK